MATPKEKPEDRLILNGKEILGQGETGELLVGGKNFNMAILSQIRGIRVPSFRAISSKAFHLLLDSCRVNAELVRHMVRREYERITWGSKATVEDPDFLRDFVRRVADIIKKDASKRERTISLRAFIDNTLEGFTTSKEDIDSLRMRSILVQVAILSVDMPHVIAEAIRDAHREMSAEAGVSDLNLAVRSSAAGEDSRRKAFAGLQDTYLNIRSEDATIQAYQWDCSSAYNFRCLTYRREAVLDGIREAESKGDESIAEAARRDWDIRNTSLSVCLMRMVDPVIAGTAFSADTATGFRGGPKNDLVSIDVSWGIGEAIVGGIVTPDKYFVYRRDDGREVVLRTMGYKNKQYIYDPEANGTVLSDVPTAQIFKWTLTIAQAEAVAKGVRLISEAYGGMIMDTEFVIDVQQRLWFVQVRPETKWNDLEERQPNVISMRRMEVKAHELKFARVLLEGNGASRGAGSGTVRFLQSALELNKIQPGDILAAERTDPDMVPGMRIASAILASAGGDTSHAAITSRELGVPAIIGIQGAEALKALDGKDVTVDGSRGRVYGGILSLEEFGDDFDITAVPSTRTGIGLILADVGQAMTLSKLRNISDFKVGLLRAEFMLGNIGIHPAALEAFDTGTLSIKVEQRLEELNKELDNLMMELIRGGHISVDFNLRKHVAVISGIYDEMTGGMLTHGDYELESEIFTRRHPVNVINMLEARLEQAKFHLTRLRISPNLHEHVALITGMREEIDSWERSEDPEAVTFVAKLNHSLNDMVEELRENEEIQKVLSMIQHARDDVALKSGLKEKILRLEKLEDEVGMLIRNRGYKSGRELYAQTLAQGLALFALCFKGRDVIYRTTDYKTNEYRNLMGGELFEFTEDNPMLGFRGVGRGVHDWEFEAFKTARSILGATNLHIMFPFVRTIEQTRQVVNYMREAHGLESGRDGLKVVLMAEIPANAILAKHFIKEVDGFSIGSNDMTQLVLGVDRDNAHLTRTYDEEDPAVVWAILTTIFSARRHNKSVGFCGQGVANSHILRGVVSIARITDASVVPDTYFQTKREVSETEANDFPLSELGQWIKREMKTGLIETLKQDGYDEDLLKNAAVEQLYEEHEKMKMQHLRKILDPKGRSVSYSARKAYQTLCDRDKQFIYATWDWDQTVLDALHEAGFSTFEEYDELVKGVKPDRGKASESQDGQPEKPKKAEQKEESAKTSSKRTPKKEAAEAALAETASAE